MSAGGCTGPEGQPPLRAAAPVAPVRPTGRPDRADKGELPCQQVILTDRNLVGGKRKRRPRSPSRTPSRSGHPAWAPLGPVPPGTSGRYGEGGAPARLRASAHTCGNLLVLRGPTGRVSPRQGDSNLTDGRSPTGRRGRTRRAPAAPGARRRERYAHRRRQRGTEGNDRGVWRRKGDVRRVTRLGRRRAARGARESAKVPVGVAVSPPPHPGGPRPARAGDFPGTGRVFVRWSKPVVEDCTAPPRAAHHPKSHGLGAVPR